MPLLVLALLLLTRMQIPIPPITKPHITAGGELFLLNLSLCGMRKGRSAREERTGGNRQNRRRRERVEGDDQRILRLPRAVRSAQ
ncbi:hypothetical protein NDU88_006056 [Pleurodeles waltl]|uniref:Secreted protein n=1 Tax=Pleurodeles waltl TaxID=8319 RepID=A0AAV7MB44_PLEWA|nr:hypothetical protein NDU88_006056 [Pleurodeles waltl]